jgi:hypothetical protein
MLQPPDNIPPSVPPPSTSNVAHIGLPEVLLDEDGYEFAPQCLDCGYSLAGTVEGPCPECGLRFTVNKLERHARAKRLERNSRLNAAKSLLLPCLAFASLFGLGTDSDVGATAYLIIVTTIGALQWLLIRHFLVVRAWLWLVGLLPLTTLAIGMLTSPTPLPWLIGIGLGCVVLAIVALRGSPLAASITLFLLYVVPILLLSVALFVHAGTRIADGHYWTDFDRPTPSGWKALPAPNARKSALWMTASAVAAGMVIPFYARRARTRLQRMQNSKS